MVQVRGGGVGAVDIFPLFPPLSRHLSFLFCFPSPSTLPSPARRNPAYEGAEAYVRFYLPEAHHIVYAILGSYAAIGLYFGLKNSAGQRAAVAATPAPSKPDYHTPLPPASNEPQFGTPAWETWVVRAVACGARRRAALRTQPLAPRPVFTPPFSPRAHAQNKNAATFK